MKIYSYKSKEKAENKKSQRRKRKIPFKQIWLWAFRACALGIFLIAILFLYYSKDLPDPNKLLDRQVAESTKIFARDNSLLYEIHGEAKRTLVNLDQISDYLKKATVSAEDKDFYTHRGISPTGILRSVYRYVIHLGGSQGGGGSTITQQFVKNAILNNKKSLDRKLREAILSLALEAKFSKDDILKLYLNEIPYGRNAYGIEAAAQTFLGKPAKDLSLAESAYLAAMPQRTTYFEPLGPHREALDARKNYVLDRMREDGYITQEQVNTAKEEKVEFKKTRTALIAPHFVFMVQSYLAEKYGEKTLEEGGLKVYTTLDPKLQIIAEQAVKDGVEKNAKKYNGHNAALVSIDPKTGQILAMVGSKDYFGKSEPEGCKPGKNCLFEPNVNVAIAERQPGSSFKPFVYVTAFGKDFKYAPATMLMDVLTNFGNFGGKNYIPENYDGSERGPISIRSALAGSLNIPAVKTLALIGVENAVQTARTLGITSPLQNCGLSLVLGGCEVKLVDHVAAYSVLANGGIKNEKTSILKILDKDGKTLEEFKSSPKEILDPKAVYLLTNIMTDNNARSYVFGPNSPLTLPDRLVAAKTGTSQKWHDGWTMGFTPSLATGVWVGNNDGTFLKQGADGVLVAAPIWNTFMKGALKDTLVENFQRPDGIVEMAVDEVSGKLPTGYTQRTKTEVFADYALPTQKDNIHIVVAFDSLTNEPANDLTPAERKIYKPFTVFHSELPQNPGWEEPVIKWAERNGYPYPPQDAQIINTNPEGAGPSIEILEPTDGQTIKQIPFTIKINTSTKRYITKVEISIDGENISYLTNEPFIFNVSKDLSLGKHTLAAKVTDSEGDQSDTSILFYYQP